MPSRKRSRGDFEENFPKLKTLGLEVVPILADGNCLFRALSQQLYGHQDDHLEIRKLVVEEMRAHRELYEPSINVDGERRAPKRQRQGGSNLSAAAAVEATQKQIDRAWNDRLKKMSKPREWADSVELAAFANKFGVAVRVWRPDWEMTFETNKAGVRNQPALNVLFHDWQHYDSVHAMDDSSVDALKALIVDSAPILPPLASNQFGVKQPARVTILEDSDTSDTLSPQTQNYVDAVFEQSDDTATPSPQPKKFVEVIVIDDSSDSEVSSVNSPTKLKIRTTWATINKLSEEKRVTLQQKSIIAQQEKSDDIVTPAARYGDIRVLAAAMAKREHERVVMQHKKVAAKQEFLHYMDIKIEQEDFSLPGKENEEK